jgi:hypothetical protein
MKATHRPDIFTFSAFDEARDLDFNGYLLVRDGGNVLVDPVAMSEHDRAHAQSLGGVAWIVITNSDHVRDSVALAEWFGAKTAGPAAEREAFPIPCDVWFAARDASLPGIEILELHGSKTPGELALVVDGDTLITGDLVRGHRGGSLNLLPDPKLTDREAALDSVAALAERTSIQAVLVGDGWPVFRDGRTRLKALLG